MKCCIVLLVRRTQNEAELVKVDSRIVNTRGWGRTKYRGAELVCIELQLMRGKKFEPESRMLTHVVLARQA